MNETFGRVILGSGRSGTTWILDCIADANGLRPVFEPMHPAESALGSSYAYELKVPGDEDATLEGYFRDLAAGRIHSRWIDYRGRRARLFPPPTQLSSIVSLKGWARYWKRHVHNRVSLRAATRRKGVLIKCIRANLMGGWLTQSLGFKSVLIVRHPGAVVESQHRLGGIWDPEPVRQRYRNNQRLHEITEGRYLDLLNARLTRLEALSLNWVIENQLPLENSQEYGYHVFYYEDLMFQPEPSWPMLCESLRLTQSPTKSARRKPSQQASEQSTLNDEPGANQHGWRSRLTSEQIDSIQRILDSTECDIYRIDLDEPLRHQTNQIRL